MKLSFNLIILSLNFGFPAMYCVTLNKLLFSKPHLFHWKNYYSKGYFLLCEDHIREAKFQCPEKRQNMRWKF